jgi:hypothetical protein
MSERKWSNSRNHLDLATLEGGIGFEWGQEDELEEQRGAYAPYSGNSVPFSELVLSMQKGDWSFSDEKYSVPSRSMR